MVLSKVLIILLTSYVMLQLTSRSPLSKSLEMQIKQTLDAYHHTNQVATTTVNFFGGSYRVTGQVWEKEMKVQKWL